MQIDVLSDTKYNMSSLGNREYESSFSKKKEFEDLKYLLVSFKLNFVIVKESLYISTMYYLLL
jgi:hypothetical protein